MPVTDGFGRISATIFVIAAAILIAEHLAGASPDTIRSTLIFFGGFLGFTVVITIIAALWEG